MSSRQKTLGMLLLLIALQTSAQTPPVNVCSVPAPFVITLYDDWNRGTSKAECAPTPLGTGTLPSIRANKAGMTVWMWCPAGTGWRLYRAAATWAWLSTNNVPTDGATIAASTDPVGALNAALDRNITLPMADPSLTPVWCPYLAEVRASRPPDIVPPPPPPLPGSWITSGLSTYNSTAGRLGAYAGIGAKGRACNCVSTQIRVGTIVYCTFAGASTPAIVAQCTKQ